MSEHPRDEEELQAFLAGESALSRRYKESGNEQPPAHVDAAILAASRWAVGADKDRGSQRRTGSNQTDSNHTGSHQTGSHQTGSRHAGARWRRSSFSRWSIPLVTAAVVVVAATLTLIIERDPELDRIYQRHDAAVSDKLDSGQEAVSVALAPQLEEEESVAQQKEAVVSAPRKAMTPQAATGKKIAETKAKDVTAQVAQSSGAPLRDKDTGKNEANVSALMEDMARPPQVLEERAAPSIAKRQRSDDAAPAAGTVAQTEGVPPPASQSDNLATDTAAIEPLVVEEVAPAREVVSFDEQLAAGRLAAKPEIPDGPAEPGTLAQSPPQPAPRDPAQWLADIEEQLDQGNVELARAAIKKFRSRYPDYELPDRLAELLPETEQ